MIQKLVCSLLVLMALLLTLNTSEAVVIKNDFKVNTEDTALVQWTPQVDFDSSGNFVVVWGEYQYNYSGREYWWQTYFRRFDSLGNPLSLPILFSDTTAYYYNGLPSVAVHLDGHFAIAWNSKIQVSSNPDLFEDDIWVQIFDLNGNPISFRIWVDMDRPSVLQDNLAFDTYPSIALDSAGNIVVVWETQDLQGKGVWGQLFDYTGERIGNNFWISNPQGSSQPFTELAQFPRVRMYPDGDFVVTWMGYILGFNLVPVARIYNSDGTAETPMVALIEPGGSLSVGNHPDFDFAPGGKLVFAWNGNENGYPFPNNAVITQIFDSLLNPVTSYMIANDVEDLGEIFFMTRVKAADDGSFLVIWSDLRVADRNLWAQKFDSTANPIGVNYRINSLPGSLTFDTLDYLWNHHHLGIKDDRVISVWADMRNYLSAHIDIYAKIMQMNDIGVYVAGDINLDAIISLTDVIMLVNYIFKHPFILYPQNPADVNQDCRVTLADVISLVNHIFKPPWTLQEGCAD